MCCLLLVPRDYFWPMNKSLCTQFCVCQLCFLVTPQGTNFLWFTAADPGQGFSLMTGRIGKGGILTQWCRLQCRPAFASFMPAEIEPKH